MKKAPWKRSLILKINSKLYSVLDVFLGIDQSIIEAFEYVFFRHQIWNNINTLHHYARLRLKIYKHGFNAFFCNVHQHFFHCEKTGLVYIWGFSHSYNYVGCGFGNFVCELLEIGSITKK